MHSSNVERCIVTVTHLRLTGVPRSAIYIHKLQPIRIPETRPRPYSFHFINVHCSQYTALLQSNRFIACFRDRHLLIITRHIIVEHIKENHKSVYKAFITTSKRLQLFDFNSWKPVSRFGLFLWRVEYFRTGTIKDWLRLQFNIFLFVVYRYA